MRIAFTAPAVPGHLNPMTALARKVGSRGHEVVFIGLPDTEPAIRAAGLAFLPACQDQYPPGELARLLQKLSTLSGVEALHYTFQLIGDGCRAALEDGPRALRDSRANAFVVDPIARGFDLAALHLGIPYIHVSNALHFDYSGYTPLCVYDWPHQTGPEALARNRQGAAMFLSLCAPIDEIERAFAERVGLKLDWTDPYRSMSRLAWLTQCPREFDFPSDHLPKQFHYAGPLHDGFGRAEVAFPWERLTGEPLDYCSMGTLQNGAEDVFCKIAEALKAPGRQLVLSVGANVNPARIEPRLPNTIVVQSAPQIELLKRASLCVTHAGLNTALESLSYGVPMVAIPVTNDQPGVAARIARTKTGAVVPLKELRVEALRAAAQEVLTVPAYRENAETLRQAIRSTNGLELAADLIEKILAATFARGSNAC